MIDIKKTKEQSRLYIKDAGVSNEDVLNDISWKFAVADIILRIADQLGIKVDPETDMEALEDAVIIGNKLCIEISNLLEEKIQLRSEGDSSESQLNREDLGRD